MRKVLLYSGGLDSELYRLLLKPDLLLFFDYGGKYTHLELKQIEGYNIQEELVIDKTFNFSKEEKEDHIVEMRNIYFLMRAFQYGDRVYLGTSYFDSHRDQVDEVTHLIRGFVNEYYSIGDKPTNWFIDRCSIDTELKRFTKSELMSMCLEQGTSIKHFQRIRTCYSPTSTKGCGECRPCLEKAIALANNKGFIKELFDKDPRKANKLIENYKKITDLTGKTDVFLEELKCLLNDKDN